MTHTASITPTAQDALTAVRMMVANGTPLPEAAASVADVLGTLDLLTDSMMAELTSLAYVPAPRYPDVPTDF